MNIIRVGTTTVGNIILVTTDNGATVYATNGTKTISGIAVDGVAKLKAKAGTWRVWAELDGQQTAEVEVIVTDSYYKEMSFGLPLSRLAVGSLVRMKENGANVNFYLGSNKYQSDLNSNRALLVRKDNHSNRRMDESRDSRYAVSEIDSWLNAEYKNMFDASLLSQIGTTKFYYTVGQGDGTVTTLERAFFLLSLTELGITNSAVKTEGETLPIASTLKIATYNGSTAEQWTRSVRYNGTTGFFVNTSGSAIEDQMTSSRGIRPAFTLPNTLLVNPTPNADGSYTLMV